MTEPLPLPSVRHLLLDIEGTTSSLSFVHDVMFPMVRQRLATFLTAHWGEDSLERAVRQMVSELPPEHPLQLRENMSMAGAQDQLIQEVTIQMDEDRKATGLKMLQGLIWREAFEGGELKAHVYEDVPPALASWHQAGVDIRIYSSGSIASQKLFFGHTSCGNLLPYIAGHYDTTIGSKRAAESYLAILQDLRSADPAVAVGAGEVAFVSDIPAELVAAQEAGIVPILSVRPGNPTVHEHVFPRINSFCELIIAGNS
jgi:enolase-phosphatase E1